MTPMPRNTKDRSLGRRKLPPPKKELAIPRSALRPDWTWIRREWEADIRSTRQIAAQSTLAGRKVSHAAIEKRANKEGWQRKNLGPEVRREVEKRLAAAAIPVDRVDTDGSDSASIVEAAALQGVEVIRQHRSTIGRARRVVEGFLEELEAGSRAPAELRTFIEQATEPPRNAPAATREELAERRAQLMKLVGLQGRVVIAREVSHSLHRLVGLERQAFNLNDKSAAAPDSIEERLRLLEEQDNG